MISKKVLENLLKELDYELLEVYPTSKGYRNVSYPLRVSDKQSERILNLILYKDEPGILQRVRRTNSVSDYLALQDFPTRKTLSAVIRISARKSIRYACLYTYLPGSTIPWEGYTMKHIKLLGKTMSDMHQMLSEMKNEELSMKKGVVKRLTFPCVVDELRDIQLRMMRYFSREDVNDAMKKKLDVSFDATKLNQFDRLFDKISDIEEKQLLHMDFVRSNILFTRAKINSKFQILNSKQIRNMQNSKRITLNSELAILGILDFEKAAYGPTIVDIARTLAFLIADCKYKSEEKVRKYFLHSGYQKRGKSDLRDLEFVDELMKFFWLYDFYKFLLHNPYEYLKENEHFMRTVGMLENTVASVQ